MLSNVWSCLCMPVKDVKWALYKKDKGDGEPQPAEDKCELCFRTWSSGFAWLGWQDLQKELSKEGSALAGSWKLARERAKIEANPLPGPSVMSVKGFELEICKVYKVLSEKDLRQHTGLNRLSKKLLNGLAVLDLPGSDGDSQATEPHYVFAHPDGEHKDLKVKVIMTSNMNTTVLKSDNQMWTGQAEAMYDDSMQKTSMNTQVSKLLGKEAAGNIMPIARWMNSKFKETDGESNDEGTGDRENPDGDETEGETEYIGVAAATATAEMAGSMRLKRSSSAALEKGGKASKVMKNSPEGSMGSVDNRSVTDGGFYEETSSAIWGHAHAKNLPS
eukprot:6490705-Amphidinium_carterae.3